MAQGKPVPSGVSISVRMQAAELQAARVIGRGNASRGIRVAVRMAAQQQLRTETLSSILRSAAVIAKQMEDRARDTAD